MKVEGVKRLIEAVTIIEKSFPKVRLLIVGDGEFKNELKAMCEAKALSENVAFTGYVENSYIPLYWTDIYAHISLQEGLPISLLEAMSVKKSIVAANVGGIPEAIINKKNGVLVEPDPKVIAKEIIDLYNDESLMRRYGEEAKITQERLFNWSRTTDEFLSIYGYGGSK
jgi:glycosyltransferase involved in cell wall biosynthesis